MIYTLNDNVSQQYGHYYNFLSRRQVEIKLVYLCLSTYITFSNAKNPIVWQMLYKPTHCHPTMKKKAIYFCQTMARLDKFIFFKSLSEMTD